MVIFVTAGANAGVRTIDQVSAFFKCGPERLIKTLIYLADGNPVAVLAPGDRDVNENKLMRALEAQKLTRADDNTIIKSFFNHINHVLNMSG